MSITKNDVHAKHVVGYLVGIVAAAFAVWLLFGSVSYDGVRVPSDLDKAAQTAKDAGTAYKPPATITATCLPNTQITTVTRDQIKLVTGKDPEACRYEGDAFHSDAAWGAFALALVGIAVWAVFVWHKKNTTLNIAIIVIGIIALLVVGALLGHPLHDWFNDREIVAQIFWRGFFAAGVIAVALCVAHEAHRRQV